jgi:SAM-dependent methyltransferase
LTSPAMPYGCNLLPLSKSGCRYRPDPANERLRRRPAISKYQPLETGKGGDKRLMSIVQSIFLRMFGHPQGLLGRLGGILMARTNEKCGVWVADVLEIGPNERVLEVGFGPGVIIQRLSNLASAGYVAGVDPSREMVEQARARNASAIQSGRVDLRQCSVEDLPFEDDSFDKALAINSMQVWPDAVAALREVRRVMTAEARVALGFTPYSGQPNKGLAKTLVAAGFTKAHMAEKGKDFCALATKP